MRELQVFEGCQDANPIRIVPWQHILRQHISPSNNRSESPSSSHIDGAASVSQPLVLAHARRDRVFEVMDPQIPTQDHGKLETNEQSLGRVLGKKAQKAIKGTFVQSTMLLSQRKANLCQAGPETCWHWLRSK